MKGPDITPAEHIRRPLPEGLVVGVMVALLVSAPGGPHGDPSPIGRPPRPAAVAPGDTVVVEMTNSLDFAPSRISIRPGTTVVWRNTSALVHTATAIEDSAADPAHVGVPEGASLFGSGRLKPGATYARTFTVTGTYRYICIPHEAAGMTGTIVVDEAR